jgi:hypothetical protein
MHEREQAEAGNEHQRALGELEYRDDAQLCAEPAAEIQPSFSRGGQACFGVQSNDARSALGTTLALRRRAGFAPAHDVSREYRSIKDRKSNPTSCLLRQRITAIGLPLDQGVVFRDVY